MSNTRPVCGEVMPLCYCTAHDGPHVHLPHLIDSQYGLGIRVYAPSDPNTAQSEPSPAAGPNRGSKTS